IRQLGEVILDELALTGMAQMEESSLGPERPLSVYASAADELSALGVAAAHAEPQPLRVRDLRRRRHGSLVYEYLTFDHDPLLPRSLEAEGLGGSAPAGVYLVRRADRRPWLVWVHGAGQGRPGDLTVSRAGRLHHKLGFNIAIPVQPGHGPRRGGSPAYPTMDPLANVAGTMRAVAEVRAIVRWLEPQSTAIVVSGLSLGSPIAALVSELEERVDAVALYTPIFELNAMIAHHLEQRKPAVDHISSLMRSDIVSGLTSVVDPMTVEPVPPPHRRLIVGALHDQMALREPALALHQRWGGKVHWHDGSHVGQVFSRRVRAVTEQFLLDAKSGGGVRRSA
ncbi:MAG: alpha/beta hydrolase, partial [Mycobacterium sp.]